MRNPKSARPESLDIRKEVMTSIGQSVFRDFNVAFSLMGLIPLCIGVYVVAAHLFTIEIFEGLTGIYFFIAVIFTLLGFVMGRRILQTVLSRLIDASVQLRQHEVMKSGFVANVAYEFRPPLAAVQLSLKNMSDGLLGPLTDPQRHTVQDCQQIVGRLTRLTTDLIEATEVGEGQPSLQLDVFAVQEVVRDVIRTYEPYLKAYHLTATMNLPEQTVLFFGDRDKFLQAFGILIDHAVRRSSAESTIRVELAFLPQEWQLIISHDITSSKADAFRAPDTVGQAGGKAEPSLGVGLRFAKGIVELHHGRFWIERQPGKSSRLVVSLPALDPRQGSRVSPTAASP
jgi:signal transduction histidine kinase